MEINLNKTNKENNKTYIKNFKKKQKELKIKLKEELKKFREQLKEQEEVLISEFKENIWLNIQNEIKSSTYDLSIIELQKFCEKSFDNDFILIEYNDFKYKIKLDDKKSEYYIDKAYNITGKKAPLFHSLADGKSINKLFDNLEKDKIKYSK